MNENDFIVAAGEDSVTIKADPEMIHDLVLVLEGLLDLVRLTRAKARAIAGRTRTRLEAEQRIHDREFQDRSRTIYRRYEEHLNNGCAGSRREAMKKIRSEFKLLAVDAKIFVRAGKQSKGAEHGHR